MHISTTISDREQAAAGSQLLVARSMTDAENQIQGVYISKNNQIKKGNIAAGMRGESLAADYLRGRGFEILFKNVKHRRLEVDIIASKDGIIYFTEVKYRRSDYFGSPIEALDQRKLARMNAAMLGISAEKKFKFPCELAFLGILEEENKTPEYELILGI